MADNVRKHIQRAVEILGSQKKLADAAGMTPASISIALKTGRVGPQLAMSIDVATNGAVSRSSLRPDMWPAGSP